ncbi:MAG: SDR family NAD(P)-dependent oxidoreductase, partial [Gammaproteobacteria bacterium]|nr:SDR family NAD(P)-dependent oxidoreductase [Gammaproteobacteria bacterium]NIT64192.1 SDR family NAD(P)-dependent oxidoreductase [Gammaproteobacteria bacterium]NIV21132.1 SDR family NAD(P)-dependent oxidoreductase [Gammaproteobacteria bacterium]NIY32772.1 SDR family NAD(P)-dependent oxidoreductase [Gammaproteobacteria bacterium]
TGGGKGIGRGIALCLADAGADVVVAARTLSEVQSVAAEVEAKGQRAIGLSVDVT